MIIEVLPDFEQLRWCLLINGRVFGYHKRSDVCDYWCEIIGNSTVPPLVRNHEAEFREAHMLNMEQLRKAKKAAKQ